MYTKVWEASRSSVCSINFLSDAGTNITTFTGFKVKKFLVTDDVIDKFTNPAEVAICFTDDGQNQCTEIRMPFRELLQHKVDFGTKMNPGYVVIDLPHEKFAQIPALKCSKKVSYRIGHPIAVLGYQLEQENLAIKSGIISSMYRHPDGLNTIQVDCTIKQGNAGSPLIDAESLEVIGVIGHRLASVARSYRSMMRIINTNLKVLREAEGKINMEEIDPIQVLIANQNQIKHMATEFFKTTSMRVGFAAELCNLVDYCPDPEDISSIEMEHNVDN